MTERIAAQLIEAMRRMPVIDTHEHQPPEEAARQQAHQRSSSTGTAST